VLGVLLASSVGARMPSAEADMDDLLRDDQGEEQGEGEEIPAQRRKARRWKKKNLISKSCSLFPPLAKEGLCFHYCVGTHSGQVGDLLESDPFDPKIYLKLFFLLSINATLLFY